MPVYVCVCVEGKGGLKHLCAIRGRLYGMHLGWPDVKMRIRGLRVLILDLALCVCLPV